MTYVPAGTLTGCHQYVFEPVPVSAILTRNCWIVATPGGSGVSSVERLLVTKKETSPMFPESVHVNSPDSQTVISPIALKAINGRGAVGLPVGFKEIREPGRLFVEVMMRTGWLKRQLSPTIALKRF